MTKQLRCEPLEEMAREKIGAPDVSPNLLFVTQDGNVVAVIVENHEGAMEEAVRLGDGLPGIVVVEKTDYGIYWENDASLRQQRRLELEEEAGAPQE